MIWIFFFGVFAFVFVENIVSWVVMFLLELIRKNRSDVKVLRKEIKILEKVLRGVEEPSSEKLQLKNEVFQLKVLGVLWPWIFLGKIWNFYRSGKIEEKSLRENLSQKRNRINNLLNFNSNTETSRILAKLYLLLGQNSEFPTKEFSDFFQPASHPSPHELPQIEPIKIMETTGNLEKPLIPSSEYPSKSFKVPSNIISELKTSLKPLPYKVLYKTIDNEGHSSTSLTSSLPPASINPLPQALPSLNFNDLFHTLPHNLKLKVLEGDGELAD